MYKVFLVDDRVEIVESIAKTVPWGKFGCEIGGWAVNGKDGYDKIQKLQPNIVITDIMMPVMDGLELIEVSQRMEKQIRFIVLSGYDDFSFAQKAIRLGVDEYLLKPASVEDICEMLQKITKQLDEEREKKRKVLDLEKKVWQSLPLLKDEYFRFLISSIQDISRESIEERFGFLQIDIPLENLMLIYCELSSGTDSRRELSDYFLRTVQEIVEPDYQWEYFRYRKDAIVLLVHARNREKISLLHFKLTMEELKKELREKEQIFMEEGTGEMMPDIGKIKSAFQQARQNLNYKINHEIINYMQIEDGLIHGVRIADKDEIRKLLDSLFEENKNISTRKLKSAVREIITIVNHFGNEEDKGKRSRSLEEWQEILETIKTMEELKQWMFDTLWKQSLEIQESKSGQANRYIENVKYIVENNYGNNITLGAVSELIGLTPAYLSAIFKQQTGQNFTEYLVNVRIRHAEEMLKTGDYKVYEVAEKVGYVDFRYFGEVFKKKTGKSPREYMVLGKKS